MVARDELVIGLAMGEIAGDVGGMVEQQVVSQDLGRLVHRHGPVPATCRITHEGPGRDLGIGVEGRQEQVAVEPVHAAAEPGQAVEDLLAVGQAFEPVAHASPAKNCWLQSPWARPEKCGALKGMPIRPPLQSTAAPQSCDQS